MSASRETPTIMVYIWWDNWSNGKSCKTYEELIAPLNWNGPWKPPREPSPRDAPGWPFVHIG